MQSLPPEVLLLILSLLDPPSLAFCQLVCKQWKYLASEERVWQKIAIQRAFTKERDQLSSLLGTISQAHTPTSGFNILQDLPAQTLELVNSRYNPEHHRNATIDQRNALRDVNGYFNSVTSFKELCKRKWCLDRAWQASLEPTETINDALTGDTYQRPAALKPMMRSIDAAPPSVGAGGMDHNDDAVEEVGRDVWRIKIDPRQGVLISTGQRGGIRVVDIQTGEVLWRLDRRMTRHFVHIEFDRGYLLFDRIGNEMEVWKQEDLCNNRTGTRGCFVHYASLFTPRPTRALRFQYPHLALATRDSHVLIWDIEKRAIIEEIPLDGSMHSEGNINYIDFDDNFVFLVGTGAKCVTVISRRLRRVIWTLENHLEAGMSPPITYGLEAEDTRIPGIYASLERRRLKRVTDSPWQRAIGRQNWAQRLMLPVQAWSAIHPDFRSRTLVVLGQTNVLLIRDYLTCFLAWERRVEADISRVTSTTTTEEAKLLNPSFFVDLRFSEGNEGDPDLSWDEMPPSQLAVAESRAMCIVGKPMLLDLDPMRMIRNDVRSIVNPLPPDEVRVGELVTDEEAGFAVYNTINRADTDIETKDTYLSSLETCSCVMMDTTLCCAVQVHEVTSTGPLSPTLAVSDYYDVLIWDFAKAAAQRLDCSSDIL